MCAEAKKQRLRSRINLKPTVLWSIHESASRMLSRHAAQRIVLCAMDFELLAMRSLPFAIKFAERHAGKLYLGHVCEQLPYLWTRATLVNRVAEQQREQAAFSLNQVTAALRADGHNCEALLADGNPAEKLAELVRIHNIDLVVAGASSRSTIGKFFVGSVVEELIRNGPCPVLSIGSHLVTEADTGFGNIICAIDFSAASLRAVEMACAMAVDWQANLTLLHVTEEPSEHARQLQTNRIRDLVPAHMDLPNEPQVLVEVGPVANCILNPPTACPPDLIVIGAKGGGAFAETASRFGSIVGSLRRHLISGAMPTS